MSRSLVIAVCALVWGCSSGDEPSQNNTSTTSPPSTGPTTPTSPTTATTTPTTAAPVVDMGADMASRDAGGDMPQDLAQDMPSNQDMMSDIAPEMDMVMPGLPGETCAEAVDVTAGAMLMDETFVGYGDDYSSGRGSLQCPRGVLTGADKVYVVRPQQETTYRIEVDVFDNKDIDPMIYLKADCAADACIDGTTFNGSGEGEQIEVTIPGGMQAFIIIDEEITTVRSGPFRLTVTVLP